MPDVTPPLAAIPTHNAAHRFIGGHMGGAYSPNDPIFWLHHANVDRIWAQWQKFQLGIGGSHPRSADYPPITQSDPWNNDPIPLGHRLNDEMWPWVTNPGNFSAEVDPQITALLTRISTNARAQGERCTRSDCNGLRLRLSEWKAREGMGHS